jgi:2-phosphosulfolactate phosphatase
VRVHVAFTPDESASAPTGVVIDVIRATSTICQALAAGYERVLCAAEVEDARALRNGTGDVTLGGERLGVRIDGFDLGNSPSEYLVPRTPVLAMSTTNGTRAIVTAAERCERVLVASLLNLDAVVGAAAKYEDDVAVFCAGVKGAFALDDAYVAGRIAAALGWERSDAAEAAVRLASSYGTREEALRQSRSGRNLINHGPELEADIPRCARVSVLDVVPRFVEMRGVAAEIALTA